MLRTNLAESRTDPTISSTKHVNDDDNILSDDPPITDTKLTETTHREPMGAPQVDRTLTVIGRRVCTWFEARIQMPVPANDFGINDNESDPRTGTAILR